MNKLQQNRIASMKIFYWQSPSGNFGDDLNEWIWDDLLPGWRAWDPERTLLGVGTILNRKNFSAGQRYLLCGSGTGFGEPPDVSDSDCWRVAFVRGPRTAALMNIPTDLAMSDPAVVIPRIARFSSRGGSRGTTAFVPHCVSDNLPLYDWKRICAEAGVEYISPRRDSHSVIRAISAAEKVITESMHGAIIADAFRVPWSAVSLVDNFNEFKWSDWGESLGLKFKITPLPKPVARKGFDAKVRPLSSAWSRLAARKPPEPLHRTSCGEVVDQAGTRRSLVAAIEELKGSRFHLSAEANLVGIQDKILECLSRVVRTYA